MVLWMRLAVTRTKYLLVKQLASQTECMYQRVHYYYFCQMLKNKKQRNKKMQEKKGNKEQTDKVKIMNKKW